MAITIPAMVQLLFSADGRASRAQAWRSLAPLQLVLCVAVAIDVTVRPAPLPAASLAVGAVLLWPSVAVAAKRFHDRGLSSWWMLWLLLAGATGASAMLMEAGTLVAWGGRFVTVGAGLIALAIVFALPGQDEQNDFGAPPGSAGPRSPDQDSPDRDSPAEPHALHQKLKMTPAPASPSARRRRERPCKPVPQSFKGLKSQVAALFEPPSLPPGARATFGRRGE